MKVALLVFVLSITACGKSPFYDGVPQEAGNGFSQVQGIESKLFLPKSQIYIAPFWKLGPNISDESSLLIVVYSKQGQVTQPTQELRVKLWMPTMGHGSFPVSMTKIQDGIFSASEMFFTMEGYWNIHFEVYQNDVFVEEIKWPLNL